MFTVFFNAFLATCGVICALLICKLFVSLVVAVGEFIEFLFW